MEEHTIISKIESAQPRLSTEERSLMWQALQASLPVPAVVSPYFSFLTLQYKTMAAFASLVLLIVSGGCTAYASDGARPGDLLFPLDRTLENIELHLARSNDARTRLTMAFTEERLRELREIIDEEVVVSSSNSIPNGRDITHFKEGGQLRVHTAVNAILQFLNDTIQSDDNREAAIATAEKELPGAMHIKREGKSVRIENDTNHLKIRIDDNGDSRFEITDTNTRVRVEEKSGEVRVKSEHNNNRGSDETTQFEHKSTTTILEVKDRTHQVNPSAADDNSLFDENTVETSDAGDRKTDALHQGREDHSSTSMRGKESVDTHSVNEIDN